MKNLVLLALILVAAAPSTKPTTQQASTIVIVVDSSASGMTKMGIYAKTIRERLARLEDTQSFNIIYANEAGLQGFKAVAVKATLETKMAAIAFMKTCRAVGGDNNIAGLEYAVKTLHADEVWFVSNGHVEPDFWKKARLMKVKINTSTEAADLDSREGLIRVAADTGGVCLDTDGNPMDLVEAIKAIDAEAAKSGVKLK